MTSALASMEEGVARKAGEPPKPTRSGKPRRDRRWPVVLTQVLIVVAFLLAWELLPRIEALSSKSRLLDPFFISSPTRVWDRIVDLALGRQGSAEIWPYIWRTLWSAMGGVVIGVTLGAACGLALSASRFLSRVFHPFITAINAVPRVALIPIVVVIFGPTISASIVVAVLVVFFVAFFNAYEGGRTVAPQLLQNAEVLGASSWQSMYRIRLPYSLAWTMAALPLAIGFSLLAVVTAEILTGYEGIGRLISIASVSADASLTFAIVIYLAIIGAAIVGLAELVKKRVLHWWTQS